MRIHVGMRSCINIGVSSAVDASVFLSNNINVSDISINNLSLTVITSNKSLPGSTSRRPDPEASMT